MSREVKPEPVPPPNEWKIRKPCTQIADETLEENKNMMEQKKLILVDKKCGEPNSLWLKLIVRYIWDALDHEIPAWSESLIIPSKESSRTGAWIRMDPYSI